ncbi:MAG: thioredoxin family protein [Chloroflexi bacterium]|nr:thioredoxin family protein [Chloroflexota bacterium]
MLDRLTLLLIFATAVALAVVIVRSWNRRQVRRLMQTAGEPAWANLGQAPDGRPALVTFSTPSCAACHTAQAPVVTAVEAELGPAAVRVIRIDAARQPEIARAFGVLTVPSTIVLTPTGRLVAVNQGFAPSGRLVEQLQRA